MLYVQVIKNNRELIAFLLNHTDPGIKVSVDFIMAWGESDLTIISELSVPIVRLWSAIKFKAEVEVVMRTPTYDLDFWVDILVSTCVSI